MVLRANPTKWITYGPYQTRLDGYKLMRLGTVIVELMERIIFDNEENIEVLPENDLRALGHKIQVYLDDYPFPPVINVEVDGELVGAYSYNDSSFLKRSAMMSNLKGDNRLAFL